MNLRPIIVLTSLVFLISVVLPVSAVDEGIPESVGISSDRLNRVSDVIQSYVDDGGIAGAVTLVNRRGELVYESSIGTRGSEDERPMPMDGLFRIYSMSKPITAVALMQLYEQNEFKLRDPITKFIPEFENLTVKQEEGDPVPLEGNITMQQLLTHTAGFGYVFGRDAVSEQVRGALGSTNLEEMIPKLATAPLQFAPGMRWSYSVAVDITGLIVERISGQPFDEYLDEHIFTPLSMDDTFFSVPDDKWDRFLPNHNYDRQNQQLRQHPAARSEGYRNVTFFSGGGGLVSTASDYMKFAQALLNGGEQNGVRILGAKTVQLMTQNHLPAALSAAGSGENPAQSRAFNNFGFGLGFGVVVNPAASGSIASEGEYSWGGAAGTIFWVDPVEDIVAVCMIQLMGSPWPLREDLKVAVMQSLTEVSH